MCPDFAQLDFELLDLEAGEPAQAHVENGPGLALGQPEALLQASAGRRPCPVTS